MAKKSKQQKTNDRCGPKAGGRKQPVPMKSAKEASSVAGKREDRPGPPPDKTEQTAPEFVWERRHTWIVLGLILAGSAAVGLASAVMFKESPFFNVPVIDEEAYVKWGQEIADGDVVGKTIFYQDPLYPYVLGLVFYLFGQSYMVVRLLQVLMGTASVALVFWTANKLFGERPALIAATIMALYRGMYFFEILILKATTVLFLSTVSCALGVAAADRPGSKWRWVAVGVSLGLLTVLRGNFLAILPFMVIWAFFSGKRLPLGKRLVPSGLLALGICLVILPVSLRNYKIAGEFVLTTSQGGANFFIGNNEQANGRYVTLPYVRANPRWESEDFKKEAEKRSNAALSPSEVSSFWFKESFKWIKNKPGDWARLLLVKARLMIHQYEIPDNHSFYLIRRLFVPVLWLPFLGFGLLWGPAVLGVLIMVRKDPRAWYPALFGVLYALSIIPFYIVARYRLAVVPPMAVFAAGFLVWAVQKWKEGDAKGLTPAGAVLVVTLFLGVASTESSRSPMVIEYHLLGNAYLKTGHPQKALKWYDEAMKTEPHHKDILHNRAKARFQLNPGDISAIMEEAGKEGKTADEVMDLGQELEKVGQLETAVQLFEKATRKDPDFFPVRAHLGYLYWAEPEVKNTEKALFHLKYALKIKPDDVMAHYNLGDVLSEQGRIDEAIGHYNAALRIDPDFAMAHYNLGNALSKQGKTDEAIRHYNEALRINPDDAKAHTNLGDALSRQGKTDEAIRHYNEALRINPDDAKAHNNLGNALSEQGRTDEAIRHYNEALRIDPDFAMAHNNLGSTLHKQGKLDEAISHYSMAIRIDPDCAAARHNLGIALRQAGKHKEGPNTLTGP